MFPLCHVYPFVHEACMLFSRDTAPNRSIALIKFRKEESAFEFAEAYNGKTFNSMHVSVLTFLGHDTVFIAKFSPRL
jgi:hypothetical protein